MSDINEMNTNGNADEDVEVVTIDDSPPSAALIPPPVSRARLRLWVDGPEPQFHVTPSSSSEEVSSGESEEEYVENDDEEENESQQEQENDEYLENNEGSEYEPLNSDRYPVDTQEPTPQQPGPSRATFRSVRVAGTIDGNDIIEVDCESPPKKLARLNSRSGPSKFPIFVSGCYYDTQS